MTPMDMPSPVDLDGSKRSGTPSVIDRDNSDISCLNKVRSVEKALIPSNR